MSHEPQPDGSTWDMHPSGRMVMSFGSGDIAINIASDEVQIGSLKTYLKILGLGVHW